MEDIKAGLGKVFLGLSDKSKSVPAVGRVEELEAPEKQGLTGSRYPTRPELFFKYPTRPDPKIENDWVPGN